MNESPFLSGNISPNCPNAWERLKSHHRELSKKSMAELFSSEKGREKKLSLSWEDFFIDLSKNRINSTTIDLLIKLVEEIDLSKSIDAFFSGKKINETENRSVLHTALRSQKKDPLFVDGENIMPGIEKNKKRMFSLAEKIINGEWKGFSDKPIKHIVNVGIGGSNLGPVFVNEALKFYATDINVHYISNIEGDHIFEVLKSIDPESTVFIIASKTFTTQETIINAKNIKDWFLKKAPKKSFGKHFIGVTSKMEKAKAFGIPDENIFHMSDWGRWRGGGGNDCEACDLLVVPAEELLLVWVSDVGDDKQAPGVRYRHGLIRRMILDRPAGGAVEAHHVLELERVLVRHGRGG